MSIKHINPALNIAIAVYPHLLITSLTLPIEMLRAGEAFAKGHIDKQSFRPLAINLVAKSNDSISSQAGLAIIPDCTTSTAPYSDLIIVPGIWRNPRPVVQTNKSVVDWLNKSFKDGSHILDVGTGSGCIPITLKSELPEGKISACDVSMNVLKVALSNEKLNQVEIDWYILDVLSSNQPFKENQFDTVISNPPYVLKSEMATMDANVLENEPHLALFVDDEDPLVFYRAIAERSQFWMKPGGNLFFEINEKQGQAVVDLLTEMEYKNIELRKDLSGKDRMVRATL